MFVNLHSHSTYSRQDGWGLPEEMCARAKELGHSAVAITDHGVITGHVPLWQAAKKADLKPIFGCEFYIVDDLTARVKGVESLGIDETPHVTVIALTQVGYRNLLKLSRISWQEGFYYRPRIDWETLATHSAGLAVLSGCVGGYPSRIVQAQGEEAAYEFLVHWHKRIENLYAEVNPCPGYGVSENTLLPLVRAATSAGVPLVVTSDSHFPCAKDYRCQDILFAHGTGRRVDDPTRTHRIPSWAYQCGVKELYLRVGAACPELRSPEYDRLIRDGLRVTQELADAAEVELPRAEPLRFAGLSLDERSDYRLLREWTEGLSARRAAGLLPDDQWRTYVDRCKYEHQVLCSKGFADYILIVADIIKTVKAMGAVVLTRGSAGGCCLMWAMGASVTDPILHDLSFERFFDDSRNDPPDIDVDFPPKFRAAALEYVTRTYGEPNVAQLANFSKFSTKSAVKAVASALRIPLSEVAAVSAALTGEDDDVTGQLASITDPRARAVLEKYPELKIADRFVGQMNSYSIHACGVIISPTPLDGVIGVMRGKDGQVVSSIDKRGAKALGHLKMDLLSVKALDIVARVLEMIGKDPEWFETLPTDDPKALDCARNLMLAGVFQLDGSAAWRVAREIGLSDLRDTDVAIAICRPGPAEYAPVYGRHKRKQDELEGALAKFHPVAAAIVRPTYGLLAYQEQVMKLSHDLARLPMAEVQLLRKGIGDKLGTQADKEKAEAWVAEWRGKFVGGCVENGVDPKEAEYWWGQIETHGGYCLTGDTVVIRGGAGRHDASPEITLTDLYAAQQSRVPATGSVRHAPDGMRWSPIAKKIRDGRLTLLQMGDDGRIRPGKLKAVHHNGVCLVYQVTTASGRTIKATANHRLLTSAGYRMVSELCPLTHCLVVMGSKEKRQRSGWQTSRAIGKTYDGQGTPCGEENPAWIDGRQFYFDQTKFQVRKRAYGCELCGCEEEGRFEFAHLLSLEACEGNYSRYHSAANLKWLCNSCHKRLDYLKGERVIRWTRGRPTELDPVTSVTCLGLEEVFDVEMATEEHNFVANGIVSHNSFNKAHSRTYALLASGMFYLKAHYTNEFYSAYLEIEQDGATRKRLIREFVALGGDVRVLDPVHSRARTYSPEPGLIVGGYADLYGVGEAAAKKIMDRAPFCDWPTLLANLTPTLRARVEATGLPTGEIDPQALVALAPWFPVAQMPANVQSLRERKRLRRTDDLPLGRTLEQAQFDDPFLDYYGEEVTGEDTVIVGFVTHRNVSPKSVELLIEDEVGVCPVRVSSKRLKQLGPMFRELQLGDLVAVSGWWSGDTLYVKGRAMIANRPVITAAKKRVKKEG